MMIKVAVTSLCEFAARRGSLEFRYTSAPSAEEGAEHHRRLQAQRPAGYLPEYSLSGSFGYLTLQGRADGYWPDDQRLEEIKTHRGSAAYIGEGRRALHWAQLKVYGAILCQQTELSRVTLQLCYYAIDSDEETLDIQTFSADELGDFTTRLCAQYADWAAKQQRHRTQRDASLMHLKFPFDDFRKGQRDLAESVFKAALLKKHLGIQAPTGLGKTLGVLFPALQAMPRAKLDRLFFLTARNTGKQLAIDSLARLHGDIRIVQLSAKQTVCPHLDKQCHGDDCPLADDFFERLPAARSEAASHSPLTPQVIEEIAQHHTLCPYYLSQEMARWADVIIADYNTFFDSSANLFALTQQNRWRVQILCDEAHNLIERSRSMYSARLDQQLLLLAQKRATGSVKTQINRCLRQFRSLLTEHANDNDNFIDEIPDKMLQSLQNLAGQFAEIVPPQALAPELQELRYNLSNFLNRYQSFGNHSLLQLKPGAKAGRGCLQIINVDPSDFLKPRWESCHSSVLFSATLQPFRYYQDLLGLPETTIWRENPSPFHSRQLDLRLVTHIDTTYAARQRAVSPLAHRIAEAYRARPGNYLVYLPSFAFLEQLLAHLVEQYPQIPVCAQHQNMTDSARKAFLENFQANNNTVGLAVLGGIFSEGIDLPGQQLIGVFIATLGLPPFDAINRASQRKLAERYTQAHEYTFTYPGLRKVIQAAGRLIRSERDTGLIELIDPRFARKDIRDLLPDWWFKKDGTSTHPEA